ncbi:MAG: ABC transporter permease [Pseudomonadota bacterium]
MSELSIRGRKSLLREALFFIELLYHSVVREVRLISGNAALGLAMSVMRTLAMVAAFYLMFTALGMRASIIRGDIVMFLVSGIMLFLMHNSAISKTLAAGSVVSPIMMHAPVTSALTILASTLADFYMFVLSTMVIFAGFYMLRGELEIYQPADLLLPFFLSWTSGVIIGMFFLLVKPFAPNLVKIISLFYQRANMVTSGKFFVANVLPAMVLPYFAWNPLFHTIDQARGAIFVNYVPTNSSLAYPIYFTLIGMVIAGMGEFWLRKTVSRSTAATH